MKKWLSILLAVLFAAIGPSYSQAAGSGLPFTYKTEVKVRLLQKPAFSVIISGTYSLIDLNQNQLINLNGQSNVSFQQQGSQIIAKFGTQTVSSSAGFAVYEQTLTDSNEFTIQGMESTSGSTTGNMTFRGSLKITPGTDKPLVINILDMENYLKGVVPGEMPALWHPEAVKAQAVVARSYAYTDLQKSAYLEMTVASQVYQGKTKEHAASTKAILDTAGIYVTYNGTPAKTFFYSSSGGKTENAEDVWGSPIPYIRSVQDEFDRYRGNTHYDWEKAVPSATIAGKLGLSSTQLLVSLAVTEYTPGGNAKDIKAGIYDTAANTLLTKQLLGTSVKYPDSYRSLFSGLKSSQFSILTMGFPSIANSNGSIKKTSHLIGYKVQKADGTTENIEDLNIKVKTAGGSTIIPAYPSSFTFKGNGYGHRAGLSQWGARGMAEAGYKYNEILKHYYSSIEVKKLN